MALIYGNPFGEIRGKVGGSVFSRNKGGQYLKVFAKPINRNSEAQQRARAVMREAGKGYSQLSLAQKQAWAQFAKDIFLPFSKPNNGNMSAANAYTALVASIENTNATSQNTTLQTFGGAAILTSLTQSDLSIPTVAPLTTVAPNIITINTVNSPVLGLQVEGCYWETLAKLVIDIRFAAAPTGGITNTKFQDGNLKEYGWAAYVSTRVLSSGQKPTQLYANCAVNTGIFTFGGTTLQTATGVRMTMDTSLNVPKWRHTPSLNEIYVITPVIVGKDGTMVKLSSKEVTFGTVAPAVPAK